MWKFSHPFIALPLIFIANSLTLYFLTCLFPYPLTSFRYFWCALITNVMTLIVVVNLSPSLKLNDIITEIKQRFDTISWLVVTNLSLMNVFYGTCCRNEPEKHDFRPKSHKKSGVFTLLAYHTTKKLPWYRIFAARKVIIPTWRLLCPVLLLYHHSTHTKRR